MRRIINTSFKVIQLTRTYTKEKGFGKPTGLWYSIDGEWEDWCRDNMDHWIKKHDIELVIDESRMLVIETFIQLESFCKKYTIHKENHWETWNTIDWKKVKEDYSGIEIRNYHELKWHNNSWSWMHCTWLYGWDVSSGCIWDLSIIKASKLLKKQTV
jgi:hypothetical protein